MTFGRIVISGMVIGALAGAATGLVLGLINSPATAWFAVIELGIPAAVAGVLVGVVIGLIVVLRRRARTARADASGTPH